MSLSITGGVNAFAILKRDATDIARGTSTASQQATFYQRVLTDEAVVYSLNHLDSPTTTSATTYGVSVFRDSGTIWVNRRGTDTVTSVVSSITLMEVAG
jgi:hypothetical protein